MTDRNLIPFERITFTAMNSEFLLLGEKQREEEWEKRSFRQGDGIRGTEERTASHKMENSGGKELNWQEELRLWFAYVEKHCSRFLPDSEVSRLNGVPKGSPVLLSLTCYEMLEEAWRYAIKTGFYFHPLVGRRLQELGYDRSFDEIAKEESISREKRGVHPNSPKMGEDFEDINAKSLTLIPGMKAVIRHTDEKIDLGGIGKGWSVDRAAMHMMERGMKAGLVDGGGDLRFWHHPGYLWRIGVEDPLHSGKERMTLFLQDGAVATSSKGYRRWKHEGNWVHHLIDGRTGSFSTTGIIQATVIGRTTTEAEVLSKVLCLMEPEEAIGWGEEHFPHLAYILFDEKNEMLLSPNFDQIVTKAVVFE